MYAVCMRYVGTRTLRDSITSGSGREPRGRSARQFLDADDTPGVPRPLLTTAPVITGRESYPDAVAAIAARLADAICYLHHSGIIHGDLKPSNILLGPGGHPYLIDFNLSTTLADPSLACCGTLAYMAPERLRLLLGGAVEEEPGTAADVYSFGVVMFEALTGELPFEPVESPDPVRAAVELIRHQAGPRPAAGCPEIPSSLGRLIDRCLDPRPGCARRAKK